MAQSRFFEQFPDRQAIYNYVCQKLWEQNECAYSSSQCRYRHGNMKCAIGHLIPEDFYREVFEGKSYGGLLDYLAESGDQNSQELVAFFRKHDSSGGGLFFPRMQYLMHDAIASKDGLFRDNLITGAREFADELILIPYVFPSE